MNNQEEYRSRLVRTATSLHDIALGGALGTCLAELRTPLGVIHGYTNLIGHLAAQPEDYRDLLDQIEDHLHVLMEENISDQLVDLYKLFMFLSNQHSAYAGYYDPPRYDWRAPLAPSLRSLIQGMRQEVTALQTLVYQLQERCDTRRNEQDDVPELIASMKKFTDILFDGIDILLEDVILKRIQDEYDTLQ